MSMSADPRLEPDTLAPGAEARPHAGRWANHGVVPRGGLGTGWVVVADEAIARILTTTEASGTLDQVEALTDPAAHTKEGELHGSDDNRHLEARAFARRVAGHLATALQQKRYDTLRIVAAPRFLGLLRQELDAAVRAVVVDELDKDLIHAADDEIAKRLLAAQPDA